MDGQWAAEVASTIKKMNTAFRLKMAALQSNHENLRDELHAGLKLQSESGHHLREKLDAVTRRLDDFVETEKLARMPAMDHIKKMLLDRIAVGENDIRHKVDKSLSLYDVAMGAVKNLAFNVSGKSVEARGRYFLMPSRCIF